MIRHYLWYTGIVLGAALLSDIIAPAPHRPDPWSSFVLQGRHHSTVATSGATWPSTTTILSGSGSCSMGPVTPPPWAPVPNPSMTCSIGAIQVAPGR